MKTDKVREILKETLAHYNPSPRIISYLTFKIKQHYLRLLPKEKEFNHLCCKWGTCQECLKIEQYNQAIKEMREAING